MIIIFVLLIIVSCLFLMAGGALVERTGTQEEYALPAFIVLIVGVVSLLACLYFGKLCIIEAQKDRAVSAEYGNHDRLGVRTIDPDIEFIISGNGE